MKLSLTVMEIFSSSTLTVRTCVCSSDPNTCYFYLFVCFVSTLPLILVVLAFQFMCLTFRSPSTIFVFFIVVKMPSRYSWISGLFGGLMTVDNRISVSLAILMLTTVFQSFFQYSSFSMCLCLMLRFIIISVPPFPPVSLLLRLH